MNWHKLIIALILMLGFSCFGNAQEQGDTVKYMENVNEICVIRKDGTTKVLANASDKDGEPIYYFYQVDVTENDSTDISVLSDSWNIELPFYKPGDKNCEANSHSCGKKNKLKRSVIGLNSLYWGWRFNYGDKSHVKNCFELGTKELIGVSWQRNAKGPIFSIGAGIGMSRYLAQDGYCFSKDHDRLMLLPLQEGAEINKSRLDVMTFHIPVLLMQPFAKNGLFTIGGVMNFNSYATSITQYSIGKSKHKINYKGLQQNLFTVDILASVTYHGIGLYASWSPMPLFDKKFGPELKAWSIGVAFSIY